MQGRGSVVLVYGEAGIGKTSPRQAATGGEAATDARVLVGARELIRSRRAPWGRSGDMACGAGGALAQAVEPGAGRDAVFGAVHQELARAPAVMVVEDVTLGRRRHPGRGPLLAWRIPALPSVLLLTYRDDELRDDHPLRRVLGGLAPGRGRCPAAVVRRRRGAGRRPRRRRRRGAGGWPAIPSS